MIRNGAWQAKQRRLEQIERLTREALDLAEADLPGPRPVPPDPVSMSALDITTAGIRFSQALSEWRGPTVNLLAQAAYVARSERKEHEQAAP